MYVVLITIVCGLITMYVTKKILYKKYSMKGYFFTKEILWLIIFGILFLPSLFFINPIAPGDTRTIIEAASVPRCEIIRNSLLIIFIFFPILFALAYIFDNILIWIKKRFINK